MIVGKSVQLSNTLPPAGVHQPQGNNLLGKFIF